MSEMKIHADDPKMIAAVLIEQHGRSASYNDVVTVVRDALIAAGRPVNDDELPTLITTVRVLIGRALINATWGDDE